MKWRHRAPTEGGWVFSGALVLVLVLLDYFHTAHMFSIFFTVRGSCSGFENIPITSNVSRLLVVKYWIILVHELVSLNNHIQEPIFLFRLEHHVFMCWITKSKSNFDAYIESKWQQGEFLFMEWDKKYVWCNFVASIFSTHFLVVEGPAYSRGKVFLCAV